MTATPTANVRASLERAAADRPCQFHPQVPAATRVAWDDDEGTVQLVCHDCALDLSYSGEDPDGYSFTPLPSKSGRGPLVDAVAYAFDATDGPLDVVLTRTYGGHTGTVRVTLVDVIRHLGVAFEDTRHPDGHRTTGALDLNGVTTFRTVAPAADAQAAA